MIRHFVRVIVASGVAGQELMYATGAVARLGRGVEAVGVGEVVIGAK